MLQQGRRCWASIYFDMKFFKTQIQKKEIKRSKLNPSYQQGATYRKLLQHLQQINHIDQIFMGKYMYPSLFSPSPNGLYFFFKYIKIAIVCTRTVHKQYVFDVVGPINFGWKIVISFFIAHSQIRHCE